MLFAYFVAPAFFVRFYYMLLFISPLFVCGQCVVVLALSVSTFADTKKSKQTGTFEEETLASLPSIRSSEIFWTFSEEAVGGDQVTIKSLGTMPYADLNLRSSIIFIFYFIEGFAKRGDYER